MVREEGGVVAGIFHPEALFGQGAAHHIGAHDLDGNLGAIVVVVPHILWALGLSAIVVSAIDLPRMLSEVRGTLG
jgi:aspartokinase-like uncharacterized kinase